MAASVKELFSGFVPSSSTQLYVSPAGTVTRIDKLTVTNNSGSSATITTYLVPSGGSASSSNEITNAQAILAASTWNSPNEYGHYLNPGDSIYAIASAASALAIFIGGTLVVQ